MIGRPPAQLVAASASALREHAQRVELLERQLDDARAVLAEAAAVALDEGASLRAIGDVIGSVTDDPLLALHVPHEGRHDDR